MAISNSLCFRLLLCTYKSNTVCEKGTIEGAAGLPPNTLSGKEEPHHKCPNILMSVTYIMCVCCRKSGVNLDTVHKG